MSAGWEVLFQEEENYIQKVVCTLTSKFMTVNIGLTRLTANFFHPYKVFQHRARFTLLQTIFLRLWEFLREDILVFHVCSLVHYFSRQFSWNMGYQLNSDKQIFLPEWYS